MRIAFAGTPEVAVPVLDALINAGHDVAFVITRPDAPSGRGRVLTASPVSESALAHNIKCFKTIDLHSLTAELAQVDCVVVVAFGAMIPGDLLNVPQYGWINVHFSLLPHWRGAAPVQYAIKAGDDVTGVSAFQIDSGLDTGPVLGSIATAIKSGETSGELLARLAIEGAALMVATLSALDAGNIQAVPQPTTGVSVAPKISKDDARVSWQLPALAIERHIRAMTPDPGAWTMLGDQRIKLYPVQLAADVSHLAPGEVVKFENEILVGTGSHAVVLRELQQAGRNQVSAVQWFSNQSDVKFD